MSPTIANVPSGHAMISIATGHRLAMPMTKTGTTAANAHSLREPPGRMPEAYRGKAKNQRVSIRRSLLSQRPVTA
jgi:hypothetical protein